MSKYLLDNDKNPVPCDDLITWARTFEYQDRVLAADTVGETRISTIFLGIDHGVGSGEPVLWETMIFGGPLDDYQQRYTSKADALIGHQNAVTRAREAVQ